MIQAPEQLTVTGWKTARQNRGKVNILEQICVSRKKCKCSSGVKISIIYLTAEADAELKHTFVTEPHLEKHGEESNDRIKPEHMRLDSFSAMSETESECCKSAALETPDGRLLYRHYIERALKNRGLRKMLR